MWDEKKFFEDFVKESENKKLNEEFTNQLKDIMKEEKVSNIVKRNSFMRYSVVVMVAVICIVLGTISWSGLGKNSKVSSQSKEESKIDVHAEKNSEIQSGIIGYNSNDLEMAITMVEDEEVYITDARGENISTEERSNLLGKLNEAKIVKNSKGIELTEEKSVKYICKGEETLEIIVYNDEYIVIGDSDVLYH